MSRAEVVTTGIDENVQLIGGDAFGRNGQTGLRVPGFVPTHDRPTLNRYLFLLATFSLSQGEKARIRGFRQLVKIGLNTTGSGPSRIVEQLVTDPTWHFTDGDISWHLQDIGPAGATGVTSPVPPPGSKFNADSFAFRSSGSPALLYETALLASPFYIALAGYTPPNGGHPYGTPLIEGGFSSVMDLRTPWQAAEAWHSLDIPLVGPRTICLYASVKQTNPSTRLALTPPVTFFPEGLCQEEQFLLNFPEAIYWRVGGSLIVDT